VEEAIQYNLNVDSKHPGCFLFLINYSESMQAQFDRDSAVTKLKVSIDSVNHFIESIIAPCQDMDRAKAYFYIGAFGYRSDGNDIILNNLLSLEESFASTSFLCDHYLKIEKGAKTVFDPDLGRSSYDMEQLIWVDPKSKLDSYGNPQTATDVIATVLQWADKLNSNCPPIVIHLTDSEKLPTGIMKLLRYFSEKTPLLVSNCVLSSVKGFSDEVFPSEKTKQMENEEGGRLFELSSVFPYEIRKKLNLEMANPLLYDSRAFALLHSSDKLRYFFDLFIHYLFVPGTRIATRETKEDRAHKKLMKVLSHKQDQRAENAERIAKAAEARADDAEQRAIRAEKRDRISFIISIIALIVAIIALIIKKD